MPDNINRRRFLHSSARTVLTGGIFAAAMHAPSTARGGQFTGRIKKAVKYHMIQEKLSAHDKLKMLKDLGYDGVEPRAMLKPEPSKSISKVHGNEMPSRSSAWRHSGPSQSMRPSWVPDMDVDVYICPSIRT